MRIFPTVRSTMCIIGLVGLIAALYSNPLPLERSALIQVIAFLVLFLIGWGLLEMLPKGYEKPSSHARRSLETMSEILEGLE